MRFPQCMCIEFLGIIFRWYHINWLSVPGNFCWKLHCGNDAIYTWAVSCRFVLAAVSPAVVVPSLLSLSERGYGIDQGIPTLVIAAASIDDVLAISAFSICLGIAFTSEYQIRNLVLLEAYFAYRSGSGSIILRYLQCINHGRGEDLSTSMCFN